MEKTKSNKKAAHATPSDDKTLQAVQATQATPSDDKTLQAVQVTPSDDKTLQAVQATQATPSDDKTLQAVQVTPSDDKTLQAVQAESDDKTLQVVQATPSDDKTLEVIMRTRPWEGNQPAITCRAILRGLIKRVAQLEEAGISCGVLDASQIIYQGSKVTIRNEPTRNEPSQARFREQIKNWASKIFPVSAALRSDIKLELGDFLTEIQNAGDNFKQLESHPFLLSYEGKANFLLEKIVKLNIEHPDWIMKYKTDRVEISKKIGKLRGYSNVFRFSDYEENALGALLYSRNVVAHIGGYFRPNKKPSKEEVGKKLSEFFPEMMRDFYKFVVNKGIDTRSEPKSVKLVD